MTKSPKTGQRTRRKKEVDNTGLGTTVHVSNSQAEKPPHRRVIDYEVQEGIAPEMGPGEPQRRGGSGAA